MNARNGGLAPLELGEDEAVNAEALRAAGVRTLRALQDQRLVRSADSLLVAEQRFVPTGFAELDALLLGGFPRGRITEVVGPPSSGRTALLLGAAGATTLGGEVAAWIDPGSALDVRAAESAGVVLSRLLWARPLSRAVAWTAADVVLRTGGFALVIVDVGQTGQTVRAPSGDRGRSSHLQVSSEPPSTQAQETLRVVPLSEARVQRPKRRANEQRVADSVWARLSRSAEQSGTALVLLADTHMAGTFAAVTLSMTPMERVWRGTAPSRTVLVGTLARARVERSKLGTPEREVVVGFGEQPTPLVATPPAATPPAATPLHRDVSCRPRDGRASS